MLYEDLEKIENGRCITKDGGVGSGIKGHITVEQMKAMKGRLKKTEKHGRKITGLFQHEMDFVVKPTIKAIQNGKDPNEAFARFAKSENYSGNDKDVVYSRNKMIDYLNTQYGSDIDKEKVNKLL